MAIKGLSIQRRLSAACLIFTLLSAAAGGIGLFSSWRIGESGIDLGAKLAPLADAAMEIKLTATKAHLLFEKIMAGDEGESIDEVWDLLEETRFYAGAILNGGENDEGNFHESESPRVREKIQSVQKQVDAFIDSARKRYQQRVRSQGTGSGADQEFDELYDSILGDLDLLAEDAKSTSSALSDISAVGRAKFHLANGHLFLEEVLSGDAGESFDDVINDFEVAERSVDGLSGPEAQSVVADIRRLAEVAAERHQALAINLAAGGAADEAFDQSFEAFIREADEAEAFVHDYMEESLAELWAAEQAGLMAVLVLMLVTIAAALAIRVYFQRSIADRLIGLSTTVKRLVAGERVDIPGVKQKDEIGSLARAFAAFADRRVNASRIKLALDNADTCVMVADADHNIVYVNQRLLDMFKEAEADIKRDLPAFRVDGIIGTNIDDFHKNPSHQRGMLDKLSGMHRAEIKVGGRDFTFIASPVLDAVNGDRLGTVVEWRDLTEEKMLQDMLDQVVGAACAGDFSKRIDSAALKGVVGRLADGINQLSGGVEAATKDLDGMLCALAEGDLTRRITADYQGTLGSLKDNANNTADHLAEIVGRIQTATVEVKNAASEISSGTADLSSRTEQAAANLEETAASTEELAATVKQNAENAKNASRLANSADQTAKTGGQVAEQAVSAVAGMEQSAQRITDIISVIDEIAFQTNLLALNASVEAARAGEAGKGFAVVAQEVRQLAQRSAQAASDIKTLIQDSNGQVKEGVELVNRAGEALAEIVGSIGKAAIIVEEIASASQEQASGVQEINGSVASMDEMTQQNSALVEESTAAARALSDQAEKLSQLMDFFKLDGAARSDRSSAQSSPQASRKSDAEKQRTLVPAANDSWAEF